MNAKEAKQLTSQARTLLISEKEIKWNLLFPLITIEITERAGSGYNNLYLNFRDSKWINFIDSDLTFIKTKLEDKDYIVEYRIERSPNGKRELIINW